MDTATIKENLVLLFKGTHFNDSFNVKTDNQSWFVGEENFYA